MEPVTKDMSKCREKELAKWECGRQERIGRKLQSTENHGAYHSLTAFWGNFMDSILDFFFIMSTFQYSKHSSIYKEFYYIYSLSALIFNLFVKNDMVKVSRECLQMYQVFLISAGIELISPL